MAFKDNFLKVPKLLPNGSNWILVRDQFRWSADACGLLRHIVEVVVEPTPPSVTSGSGMTPASGSASGAATTVEAAVQEDQKALRGFDILHDRWCQNEVTIKQAIANAVPDSVFNRIKAKRTAKEVWDALVAIYEERSLMVAIDL
ncbi:hypothetical protein CPB83DRAFT_769650, partial [Crepidotus variabilis]